MVRVHLDFASAAEVATLAAAVRFYDPAAGLFRGRPEAAERKRTTVEMDHLRRDGLRGPLAVLLAVRRRIADRVAADAGRADLVADLTILAAMVPGDGHARHADNWRPTPDGGRMRNHTHWRAWSAILYLSSHGPDFDGGTLEFPDTQLLSMPPRPLVVRPVAGTLVTFDSAVVHEVPVVTRGWRATMPVWFTADAGREERVPAAE